MTFKKFLKKLDEINPNREFKLLSKSFINRQIKKEKLYTQDEFGICKIGVISLLNGVNPSIKTAVSKKQYSINKYKKFTKFGHLDFSNTDYNGALEYSTVRCRKHGIFNIKPNWLLNGQGCGKCFEDIRGMALRSNTKDFVNKAMLRLNTNKNIYDKVNYLHAKEKILIKCDIHNFYYPITPNDHLTGYGCPQCGLITGGYSREAYIERAENKDNLIYLIKCWNDEETFYKIGRTYNGVSKRFSRSVYMPYKYEVLYEYRCSAECVFDKELELHLLYRHLKYNPEIYFAGYTECFNTGLPIDEIISYLNSL
jgi:hypothetical protein